MRIAGQRHDEFARVDPHSFGQLSVKIGDAFGRSYESVAIGIFADPFENEPHAVRNLF